MIQEEIQPLMLLLVRHNNNDNPTAAADDDDDVRNTTGSTTSSQQQRQQQLNLLREMCHVLLLTPLESLRQTVSEQQSFHNALIRGTDQRDISMVLPSVIDVVVVDDDIVDAAAVVATTAIPIDDENVISDGKADAKDNLTNNTINSTTTTNNNNNSNYLRRWIHLQLALRFTLFAWAGLDFVQEYQHCYMTINTITTNMKKMMMNKKKKKKKRRPKQSQNAQHSSSVILIRDMIELIQYMAIRLLPHEHLSHFIRTECVIDMTTTGSSTYNMIATSSSKLNKVQQQQQLFAFLQPIWDSFEMDNPFRHHVDDDDDDKENDRTTSLSKTKQRKPKQHRRTTTTSSDAITTMTNTTKGTSAATKKQKMDQSNPLLRDKVRRFTGHHFNNTTVGTMTNRTRLLSTTATSQNNIDISQLLLFRQVPTRRSVTQVTTATTAKKTRPNHDCNQPRQSLSTTYSKKENVPPPLPLHRSKQDNSNAQQLLQHNYQQQQQPMMIKMNSAMSVVKSTTTMSTKNPQQLPVTTTTTTQNLVVEAMEAIQRRKERRRQQQQQQQQCISNM